MSFIIYILFVKLLTLNFCRAVISGHNVTFVTYNSDESMTHNVLSVRCGTLKDCYSMLTCELKANCTLSFGSHWINTTFPLPQMVLYLSSDHYTARDARFYLSKGENIIRNTYITPALLCDNVSCFWFF